MSIFELVCVIWSVCGLQVSALHTGDKNWWRNTQIYEIYLRSFKDSDGDGIGDLRGVISMLDHFVDLKIETLWITPFFKSPMEDRGYDIEVFEEVDPLFGNMDDFNELMVEVKRRNMRVLMDFVGNHSSSTHEWFQKSVDRIKPFDEFYVWADAKGRRKNGELIPPNNWVSRFDGSAWEWNEKRQQFYLHQFLPSMPDFDLRNEALKKRLKLVIKFWLDKGLDGFRLDAANYLLEDPELRDEPLIRRIPEGETVKYFDLKHIYTKNLQENLDFTRELRSFLDEEYNKHPEEDEKILITEAYAPVRYTIHFYGSEHGKSAHYPFNFSFTQMAIEPSAGVLDHYIKSWLNEVPKGAIVNWNAENHDLSRITGRLSDEYHAIITTMQMTLPGVACIYYGQEIGMTDINPVVGNAELSLFIIRDRSKAPMQWDDSLNAGFTSNEVPWLPMQADYRKVNVKLQKTQPDSPYNRFKLLSTLRQTPTLQLGELKTFVLTKWVLAFTRNPCREDNTVLYRFFSFEVWVSAYRQLRGHPTYLIIANLGTKTAAVDPYVEGIEKHEILTVVLASENSLFARGFEMPSQSVLLKIIMKPKSIVVLTTRREPVKQRRASR